jgi:hypothetical protein
MLGTVKLYRVFLSSVINEYSSGARQLASGILGDLADSLSGSRYGNILTYYHDNTKKVPLNVSNSFLNQGVGYATYSPGDHILTDDSMSFVSIPYRTVHTYYLVPNDPHIL